MEKVSRNEIGGTIGKLGVERVNENGEHLVYIWAARGLFWTSIIFWYKVVHRHTWKRKDERGELKSVIDYIAVDETKKGCVKRNYCERDVCRTILFCCVS